MEQPNRLMDTVIAGAILILCFIIPFFIMIPLEDFPKIPILKEIFCDNSNLLAKWAAIGVLAHIVGSIVTVVAICLIKRPYQDEPAREYLRDIVLGYNQGNFEKITDKSHRDRRETPKWSDPKIEKIMTNLDADAIWAWIHYSDSRKELIDWGRRKLHYAYLAENWMIAIIIGTFIGSWIAGLYAYSNDLFEFWRFVILICFAILSGCCCIELCQLRKKNIKWDNDMVAIYIVARIWRDMEDRFLPSLIREKEIQNKNQNPPDSNKLIEFIIDWLKKL